MLWGYRAPDIALFGVIAAWLVLTGVAIFVWRQTPKEPGRGDRSRDERARYGFAGQIAGALVILLWRRMPGTDIIGLRYDLSWAAAGFILVGSALAVWLAASAMIAIGQLTPVGGRVPDDFRLRSGGPFGIVRHPTYTAWFLLLATTGLAWSPLEGLLLGLWIYAVSTHLRATREEKLLSSGLGTTYSVYAARVPRFVPRLWPSSPHPIEREAAFAAIYTAVYLAYLFVYQEGEWLHWVSLVAIPVAALPLLGFYRSIWSVLESLGFSRTKARRGWIAVLGLGVAAIAWRLMNRGEHQAFAEVVSGPSGWWMPAAAFGMLIVTVATTEEIFFRGMLQTRLANRLRSERAGWLIASAAFAIYQVPYAYLDPGSATAGHLRASLQIAAVHGLGAGLVLGGVYWRSGRNLAAAIVLHALIDLIPATRLVASILQR